MESVTCCSYALLCQCTRRPIKFAHTDHRVDGEDELFDRMAPGMAKCDKTGAKCEIVVSGQDRSAFLEHHLGTQIVRASCRARVCQSVSNSLVAGTLT